MSIKDLEGVPMDRVPSPSEDLIEELKDPDFKREYGAEQAKLEFAVILREARTEAGLTQQQLASRLGRSQPYVAKLEGGEGNPTVAAIGRMLALLDLRLLLRTAPIKPQLGTDDWMAMIPSQRINTMVGASGGEQYMLQPVGSLESAEMAPCYRLPPRPPAIDRLLASATAH